MIKEELVKEIQKGKDVSSNLEKLYENNIGIIQKLASKYANSNNKEDLLQEAFFAIKQAAELWNPDNDIPFIYYAIAFIKGHLIRYSFNDHNIRIPFKDADERKELRSRYNITSIERELYKDVDGNSVRLIDTIPDPDDPIGSLLHEIESDELSNEIWKLVNDLDERESKILYDVFKQGKTLKECSKELNISSERCRQIQNHALRKMRDKHRKELSSYLIDSIESYAYSGSGLRSFKYSNKSSVEKAVIQLFDK